MSISQWIFKSKAAYVLRDGQVKQSTHVFMDEQIAAIFARRATDHLFPIDYSPHCLSA